MPAEPKPKKQGHFSKGILISVVALAAIAIVAATLLIPQGAATIPLNANFNVGEKMVYNTTESIGLKIANFTLPDLIPSNATMSGQETIQVLSFDGQTYTLNRTTTQTEGNKSYSFSTTETMNKTGYYSALILSGNSSEEVSDLGFIGDQYLAQLLNQPVVKVGDTVTVPYPSPPSSLSSIIQTTGDLTLTFKGFQDLTVPAGTFKVFRVDLTSNDLSSSIRLTVPIIVNGTSATPKPIVMNMDINYQVYVEYNTMRQIESTMQETVTWNDETLSQTLNMTLNQDINP
jgi:hypothetical protein